MRSNNRYKIFSIIFLALVIQASPSCKKFVEVGPSKTQLIASKIYTNDATANAAMVGIYGSMMGNEGYISGGDQSISVKTGLSCDELEDYSFYDPLTQFYTNSLNPDNSFVLDIWRELYQYIYYSNSILEGLPESKNLSAALKKQLEGEAKFVRAFCYSYLVSLFGDIPIVLSTDYRVNAVAPRSLQSVVYTQMVNDLMDAQNLLMEDYLNDEKTRPNKYAATALLARVYLYSSEWEKAEIEASKILSVPQFQLVNLDQVFLKNSAEAIWQLHPVVPLYNTMDAYIYTIRFYPYWVVMSDHLVNAFESGDHRKESWVGEYSKNDQTWHFPYKYKVGYGIADISEYLMVFRLAEQYLIRSEARAQQGNLSGSIDDINVIRTRAALPEIHPANQEAALAAIEQERRVELFTEWGHRWIDLTRTNRSDEVLGLIKTPYWQIADNKYPIPNPERQKNSSLSQNDGY